MDSLTKRKVLFAEERYKDEARARNVSAMLRFLQLGNFFTFITLAVLKMVETIMDRFEDQTPFSVVATVILVSINVAYIAIVFIADGKGIWPIYDTRLRENVYHQTIVYLVQVPLLVALFIAIRWTLYTITDNDSSFSDFRHGTIYTFGSIVEWFIAVMCADMVFDGFNSYSQEADPTYFFVSQRGIKWNASLGPLLKPEYDPKSGMTVLKPGSVVQQ